MLNLFRDDVLGLVLFAYRFDFPPPRTPPPRPYRHAELVSASVGKAYDEKLRSFCFKNNDFFSSSSDRSRNKFGMAFLVLFFLIVARG